MNLAPFCAVCTLVASAVISTSKFAWAEFDESQLSPVVQTESGAVVGKIEPLPHGKSVFTYLGIPYAEPPIKELRFRPPKPAKPWSGTKKAFAFGAECPQTELTIPGWNITDSEPKSEDCLHLNVFVPSTVKPDDKLAVMVWIHGGAFTFGSANIYHGGILATFNDVIVVTLNYRLGVLGFFNVPGTEIKGNYGILDQVLALKWVQANIARFGGDRNRVTIFGESAGGISVSYHLLSPLSRDLFARAIAHSGSSLIPSFGGKVGQKSQMLELFAEAINCSMGPSIVECVGGKSVEDILAAQGTLHGGKYNGPQDIIAPVVDGEFLPDLPENLLKTGTFHDVDVITGFTSSEGALMGLLMPPEQIKDGVEEKQFEFALKNMVCYVREKSQIIEDLILFHYRNHQDPEDKLAMRKALLDYFGDVIFAAPALKEAKFLAKGGRPPFVYVFDYEVMFSNLPDWAGVIHGTDILFTFGAPFKDMSEQPYTKIFVNGFSETEKGFSFYIMKMWTDFAKYGSPNPPDSGPTPVTWPAFTEEDQAYLVLDLKPRVELKYRADKVAFWNELVPKMIEFTKTKEMEEKGEDKETAPKDEL